MVRRFRKRRSLTWLPNWGTTNSVYSQLRTYSRMVLEQDGGDTGYPLIGVLPLIRDLPPERKDTAVRDEQSLADVIGSEYYLRRIVGKIWIANRSYTATAASSQGPTFLVKMGLFVARADEQSPDLPLNWANTSSTPLYDPWSYAANREPWIFQRSWVLGWQGNVGPRNDVITGSEWTSAFLHDPFSWPASTAGYLGLHTGPHIDIKTKRRIRQDDRLYWTLAAEPIFGQSIFEDWTGRIDACFDYRALGALRRARQTGTF